MTREYIGDYYAMLISSVPGILYSIYRFFLLKKLNMFGIFMIVNLVIGTLVDVLSGSALQMLWNNVFYSYAVAALFLLTVLFKKPLFLYFSLDFVEMQGFNREEMKKKFSQPSIFVIFTLITIGFAFRDILLASIKIWLINHYGVEAFDKGIVIRQILGWGITLVAVYGFIHISKRLNADYANEQNNQI